MALANSKVLEVILKAKDEASKVMDTATKNVQSNTNKMAAAGAGMMAVGGAIGTALLQVTKGAQSYAMEVKKFQRLTNLSAEDASRYVDVLQRVGVEGAAGGKLIGKLSQAIVNQSKDLKAVGIATQDAAGKNRDAMSVIGDLADYYKNATDKTAANALMMKVLGKSWQDLLPLLALGKDGIIEAGNAAIESGKVVTQEQIDQASRIAKANKDMKEAIDGIKIQLGIALMPLLEKATVRATEFAKALSKTDPKNIERVAKAMAGIAAALVVLGGLASAGFVISGIQSLFTSVAALFGTGAAGAGLGGIVTGFFSNMGVYIGYFFAYTLPEWIAAAVPATISAVTAFLGTVGATILAALGAFLAGLTIGWLINKIPFVRDFQTWLGIWLNNAWTWFYEGFGRIATAISQGLLSRLPGWARWILGIPGAVAPSMPALRPTGYFAGMNSGLTGGGYFPQTAAASNTNVYLDGIELNRATATTASNANRTGVR